jgi:hypothetical protein
MNRRALRPALASVFTALVCLAVSARPGAVGSAGPIVERLVATAVTVTDLGRDIDGRIDIVIERWSSEEQASLIRTSLDSGAPKLLAALQFVQRRAGFVLSPGIQGTGSRARLRRSRNIQFAHEIKSQNGRQVVIATDQHLGFGEPRSLARTPHDQEFTLIDIRFGADGIGVGKIASESKVAYNRDKKTLELADFGKLPERLTGVKSEPWPQKY